jgi:hypothetical protein
LVNMDTIDKTSGLTPRQMAMTFLPSVSNKKIPLILSLDPKFNDNETCIATVPVKVSAESRELCVNFGAYLRRKFGDKVLQFFTSEKKRDILSTVFDETTQKFLNNIDQDLDDIDTDLPAYMLDLSVLNQADEQNGVGKEPNLNSPEVKKSSGTIAPGTETTANRPTHDAAGVPILYMVAPNDDLVSTCDTLSTFKSKIQAAAYKVPEATTAHDDGVSAFGDDLTQMTAASIISKFEQRFISNEESINTTNIALHEILNTLRNQGGSPPATKQNDSPSSDGVSSPDLGNSKGESGTGRVSTDRPAKD